MKDEDLSEYMSAISKRRKKPYLHFKDPEKARDAQKKSVEARKKKK